MQSELWKIQEDFTKKFWDTRGGFPRTEEALTTATKDYAIHLIGEITEVLGELSWKMHRAAKGSLDRTNVLEEFVDCQKFLLGMIILWEFTEEEFINEFKRKSMVVEQRFAQEQQFSSLKLQQVALVDIDGVLADYPFGFYKWIATVHMKGQMTVYQAEKYYTQLGLRDRQGIKTIYRASGAKKSLAVLPGAHDLLRLIRHRSQLKIILFTNRPYDEHYRIYPDTLEWLKEHDLVYDAVFWAKDKGLEALKYFDNICFAVDDSDDNIKRFKQAGISTIQVNPCDVKNNTTALTDFARQCLLNAKELGLLAHYWNNGRKFE